MFEFLYYHYLINLDLTQKYNNSNIYETNDILKLIIEVGYTNNQIQESSYLEELIYIDYITMLYYFNQRPRLQKTQQENKHYLTLILSNKKNIYFLLKDLYSDSYNNINLEVDKNNVTLILSSKRSKFLDNLFQTTNIEFFDRVITIKVYLRSKNVSYEINDYKNNFPFWINDRGA
jgi:hypothetical protein